MNSPIISLPIGSSSSFDEEVTDREIVSDGVPPSLTTVAEVGEVLKDILVDVSQNQLLIGAAEDCHADQPNVRVLRFWLLGEWNTEKPRIKLG